MKKDNNTSPPRLANRFLRRFAGIALIEDIEGDLHELYSNDRKSFSRWRSDIRYWRKAISIVTSYSLHKRKFAATHMNASMPLLHPTMMLFYVRSAIRYIFKSPVYSFINVLGLTLGVCACLAIYLIARHEFGFDKFHADRERIYRLVVEAHGPDGEWLGNTVPAPLPPAIRDDVAGVEVITRISRYEPSVTIQKSGNDQKEFPRRSVQCSLVEPGYFDILQREWIAGSAREMNDPFKVVLTESQARTYFEATPVDQIIGKIISYDDSLQATVVGVVKDWNKNTDFTQTDFISYATVDHSFLKNIFRPDDWNNYVHSFQSLVKLRPGISADAASNQFTETLLRHTQKPTPSPVTIAVQLQQLSDIHFDKRKNRMPAAERQIYVLGIVSAFILISAVFNFINLSTALSTRRSREIGIRKTIGASKSTVTMQFLTETTLLTTVSVIFACLLIQPLLRLFSAFIPQGVSLQLFTGETILFLILLIVGTGIIAGYYPSRVLSSYRPAMVLRKLVSGQGSGTALLRKTLIVVQFAFSISFIAGAIIVRGQMHYINEKDRGFNTLGVSMFWTNFDDYSNRPSVLVEKIRNIPGVESASLHGGSPMGYATFMNHAKLAGNKDIDVDAVFKSGDAEYIPLYGIRIIAGRNISHTDSLREFVVTETFAKALGFTKVEDAIGHFITFNEKDYPIVGIASDFHQHSFHEKINPVAIGNIRNVQHAIAIRFDAQHVTNKSAVLANVEKLFKQLYPDDLFQPHDVEEEIGWMHQDDTKMAMLINAAMILTVFISALGVFGLVMFTSEVKTKEVAVRKVLGATVANIAFLFGREFLVLLLIASVLAFPLAWYSIEQWLSTFEYRTNMTVSMYLFAALAALTVGLITVSYHTFRAASVNPAKSLKSE